MNKSQFEKLYADNYGMLYFFILGRVRNKHIAEDLTCQAFADALEQLEQLRDTAKAKAWLWTIGLNLLNNKWRRDKIVRYESADDHLEHPDPYDFVDELARFMECQRAIHLLAALQPKYRQAIKHYLAGHPIKTAARIAGVPKSTAGTRLHNAKNELRELCAA